ncbi:MAG TPA: tRNA 2-thiouridine(34) synthase MnmA [Bacteroidetes bacterium]|nr:tRNA 2-thiouridine(34) synthase MnmA [Bacteroidota bacterium]
MNNQNKNRTVVLGMSGGVDSSVCAALLVEQGYNVIGITIKTFNYDDVGGTIEGDKSCCSLDGINDARIIAAKLGFPHYVMDFSEVFGKEVIDNFIDEYMHGRTPNPCVICNRKIKWEELLRKGMQLGADYVAMGHYAKLRIDETTKRYVIERGKDTKKDQSYMLWNVTQESLSRTLFPLANYTKEEVRLLAVKYDLRTAAKGESFEICFITDNNYERFLKHKLPTLENDLMGGEVVLNSKKIAEHNGFPFYTVGQRKGLGIAHPDPLYVTSIDYKENKINVGYEKELFYNQLFASKLNLIKYDNLFDGKKLTVKIRYKDTAEPAIVTQLEGNRNGEGRIKIDFESPKRAITPGQSVVFYEGDDLVGGAIIDAVTNHE